MTKYDDASWHYGGDFPEDLDCDAGGTHIGMFLRWAVEKWLISETFRDDAQDDLDAVRNGAKSGRELLFEHCDGKLLDIFLSEEGNRFAAAYYDDGYADDFGDVFEDDPGESLYHVADTAKNFELVAKLLDERFAKWRSTGSYE